MAMSELTIAPEVGAAIGAGRPVVALESTVIAHGMSYPDNLRTAQALEAIIRDGGATPATIAVIGGRARIGLSPAELEFMAREPGIAKASSRDLAYLMTTGSHGATTVAATARLAARAGIPVFATGGIGGVHRGAGDSFDISADLHELARNPVAVVAAGAKSILDIGATLEVLETLSVPVVVHGADRFPAFHSRDSGFRAPSRLDDPPAIAAMMRAHWRMGFEGGILIANPIPSEDEIPPATIEAAVAAATNAMTAAGIGGKEATPFLLAKINELTAGACLKANIALLKSNAGLAAAIAVAYSALPSARPRMARRTAPHPRESRR